MVHATNIGRDTSRALGAALSSPRPFRPQAGRWAEQTSNRLVSRLAPEGKGARRLRPLRCLEFADRRMTPYLKPSLRMPMGFEPGKGGIGASFGGLGDASWIFPTPWYFDEFAWLQAQRYSMAGSPRAAIPTAYVAPSLAGFGRSGQQSVLQRPIRAWNPLVSQRAAQATSMISQLIPQLEEGMQPHARVAPSFTYVAASEWAKAVESGGASVQRDRLALALHKAAQSSAVGLSSPVSAGRSPTTATAPISSPISSHPLIERPSSAFDRTSTVPSRFPSSSLSTSSGSVPSSANSLSNSPSSSSGSLSRLPSSPVSPLARVAWLLADSISNFPQRYVPSAGPRVLLPAGIGGLVTSLNFARNFSRPILSNRRRQEATPAFGVVPDPRNIFPESRQRLGSDREELGKRADFAQVWVANSSASGFFRFGQQTMGETLGQRRETTSAENGRTIGKQVAGPSESQLGQWQQSGVDWVGRAGKRTFQDRPNALSHLAWSDRWLARFAGASKRTLASFLPSIFMGSPEIVYPALGQASMLTSQRTKSLSAFKNPVIPAKNPVIPAKNPVIPAVVSGDPGTHSLDSRVRGNDILRANPDRHRVSDLGEVGFRDGDITAGRLLPGYGGEMPPIQVSGRGKSGRGDSAPPARFVPAPVQDDEGVVSDDVFAMLSRAAARDAAVSVRERQTSVTPQPKRRSAIDRALTAPIAIPAAGVQVMLAASPSASSLAGVLGIAPLPSFDVRGIAAMGLAHTYLAGLVGGKDTPVAVPQQASAASSLIPGRGRQFSQREPQPYLSVSESLAGEEKEAVQAGPTFLGALPPVELGSMLGPILVPPTYGKGISVSSTEAGEVLIPDVTKVSAWEELLHSAQPGALGERLQQQSMAMQRAVADLSFDFVVPELVMAAQLYGLDASSAAAAARLSTGGQKELSLQAAALDQTLVALSHGSAAAHSSGYAFRREMEDASAHYPSRMFRPKGAVLWPNSALQAWQVKAPNAERDYPNSLAALDLLAAQVVADAGWQSAMEAEPMSLGRVVRSFASMEAGRQSIERGETIPQHTKMGTEWTNVAVPPERRKLRPIAPGSGKRFDPELVTSIEQMYTALSELPSGMALTPSVRAARALALAEEVGSAATSARVRAAMAWASLPVVLPGGDLPQTKNLSSAKSSPGAVKAVQGHAVRISRAGESLQSLVQSPLVHDVRDVRDADSAREFLSVQERAPTAAQELVQTGSPSPRTSSVPPRAPRKSTSKEIPAWLQETARRMFASVGGGGDISLAEMTLVQTAPATQVAASTRDTNVGPRASDNGAESSEEAAGQSSPEDIGKIAEQCYEKLMEAMQVARWRNGDPWLS